MCSRMIREDICNVPETLINKIPAPTEVNNYTKYEQDFED